MGVAAEALAAILGLAAAAALTAGLERLLLAGAAEPGPARRLRFAGRMSPPNADRWLYPAGPVVALTAVTLGFVVLPFGPGLIVQDLEIGVFWFIVVVDVAALGIALAGWGANTADAVESCYRAVAQLVAYVVPLGLALVGVIMMAGSMRTTAIVEAQSGMWFVALQPLGFALYLVTGLMQAYRAPFLEPFAAGIGHGVLGVAAGWQAVAWRLALSGLLFVVAAMGAVLFLGGWHGPWLPGWAWMTLKTFGLATLMVWGGRRFGPVSTAAMLGLAWKVLIPVGLVNVLVVGALVLLGIGPA